MANVSLKSVPPLKHGESTRKLPNGCIELLRICAEPNPPPLVGGDLNMARVLAIRGLMRLRSRVDSGGSAIYETTAAGREAMPPPVVDAQLRALRFVRNLSRSQIDRVIADVESGKVKI